MEEKIETIYQVISNNNDQRESECEKIFNELKPLARDVYEHGCSQGIISPVDEGLDWLHFRLAKGNLHREMTELRSAIRNHTKDMVERIKLISKFYVSWRHLG